MIFSLYCKFDNLQCGQNLSEFCPLGGFAATAKKFFSEFLAEGALFMRTMRH